LKRRRRRQQHEGPWTFFLRATNATPIVLLSIFQFQDSSSPSTYSTNLHDIGVTTESMLFLQHWKNTRSFASERVNESSSQSRVTTNVRALRFELSPSNGIFPTLFVGTFEAVLFHEQALC